MNKTRSYTFLLIIFLLFTFEHANAQTNSFALLELYTSEGCSSCPSAEALLPHFEREYGDQLYILEFHVDYWNRLGWEDKYSDASYSARQRFYTTALKTKNVYTPQAIINGRNHAVGSDKLAVKKLINSELKRHIPNRKINLLTSKEYRTLKVNFDTELNKGETLSFALVQAKATVQIKKGENEGRTLIHTNIVRALKNTTKNQGDISFYIPEEGSYQIIAFIQDLDTKIIHYATRTNIK